MKGLLVLPAYNESENIVAVVENIKQVLPNHDFVIINDGSQDNTTKICTKNSYNMIELPVNLGLEGAFLTGVKYALKNGYDYIIQFDSDGQHLPEYVPVLAQEIENGYDIVIGSRFLTEKKDFSPRMIGSRFIGLCIKLTTGKTIKDPTSGMRAFNKATMKKFARQINLGPEPDTVSYLIKNGATFVEVPVKIKERAMGESYLNMTASIKYMLRMSISILLIQTFRKGK